MNIPELYFGPADGAFDWLVSPKQFKQSLLLTVLLRGNVRIPEVFFFIEGPLLTAINENDALVRVLLERGVMTPMFRRRSAGTFTDALVSASMSQGVVPSAPLVAKAL